MYVTHSLINMPVPMMFTICVVKCLGKHSSEIPHTTNHDAFCVTKSAAMFRGNGFCNLQRIEDLGGLYQNDHQMEPPIEHILIITH